MFVKKKKKIQGLGFWGLKGEMEYNIHNYVFIMVSLSWNEGRRKFVTVGGAEVSVILFWIARITYNSYSSRWQQFPKLWETFALQQTEARRRGERERDEKGEKAPKLCYKIAQFLWVVDFINFAKRCVWQILWGLLVNSEYIIGSLILFFFLLVYRR